jgi:hypothetical protein
VVFRLFKVKERAAASPRRLAGATGMHVAVLADV